MLEVLRAAEAWLAERGVDAPRRSVELLMGRVLGVDRMRLYLAHDRPLSRGEKNELRELVARRGRHEPLAYLLGDWEFYGLTFEVTPAVLIPRPETEGLVERALAETDVHRVVELGTGSGAIAIALARERPDWQVWATDLSAAALDVARRNVARHGVDARVHLLEGDYWEPVADFQAFDLCIANPPYVDPARPELVADDVKDHEPGVALWTPPRRPDEPYRRIVAGVGRGLRPGGRLLLETGAGAADAAHAVLRDVAELVDVELYDDLEGRPRYLCARRA